MRAAIYARYSSDNQRDASIEDQIEVCRRYAGQMGWQVTEIFDDRAISGADSNRPGYQALLAETRRGRIDVVIIEALDRLGRKIADLATVFDDFQFRRIALHAVNVGAVTAMHVGLLGTMAQIYLTDLRDKTKRGQLGRVLQGKAAAGKAYGYDVVDGPERGERRINPVEAPVVQRIFKMFANGVSPRLIARRLNEDHVPGPEGRDWQDTTIRGQRDRGTGILNNELYIGQLVWNRCSYVKDPRTGKRVSRPNPPEEWERTGVPQLRIIEDDLWCCVKRRQNSAGFEMARDPAGNALNRVHRRKFLLSGLLTCGGCGAGYTIVGKDRYGCAGHRSKGTCPNDRTIGRQEVESRILAAIKNHMLSPELVAEFTRTYQEEVNRMALEVSGQQAENEAALTGIQRKIDGILRAIEDGLYQPSMKSRMAELETEKSRLIALRATSPALPPISIHPNLAELYRRRVTELETLLDDTEHRDEAMEVIRSMIDGIDLHPRPNTGMDIQLKGDLARILMLCSGNDKAPEAGLPGLRLSVVAGVGFEPTTFRL